MGDIGQRSATTPTAPEPLTDRHDVSTFDCGQPALDEWLRNRAAKGEGRFSRTYVVCLDAKVVAYFCTAVGAIERAAAPGKLRRNAPDPIPVAILARRAVDKSQAGKGLGKDLVADAFRRIAAAARHVGISAILVHAKDEAARTFYMKCAEFIEYPADSRTLFIPIETIVMATGR